jgi:ribosomal-protein-alanine N-acetyltransferase
MFVTELDNRRSHQRVAVSREENRVVGFMIFWVILDECHLMNLATHPLLRRQGIARVLMDALLEEARARGVRNVSLEVRVSNRAAIRLYESLGFQPVGLRKGYYRDGESAALYSRGE